MITLNNQEGRLIELRVRSNVTLEHLQEFPGQAAAVFKKIGVPAIVCTDLRDARVFPPGVPERITEVVKASGPHVLRNAFMVRETALFSIQVERFIREANAPNRKAFRTTLELKGWLDDVLTPKERTRLGVFLDEL